MAVNDELNGLTTSLFQISCQRFDPPLLALTQSHGPITALYIRLLLKIHSLRFIDLRTLSFSHMIACGIIGSGYFVGWFGFEDNVS